MQLEGGEGWEGSEMGKRMQLEGGEGWEGSEMGKRMQLEGGEGWEGSEMDKRMQLEVCEMSLVNLQVCWVPPVRQGPQRGVG